MKKSKLKWIRDMEQKSQLPFLILYQSVGIATSLMEKNEEFDKLKSGSIAIATSQLQKRNFLLKGTNQLSSKGIKFQTALLEELGQKKAKLYVSQFDEILKT